MCAYYSVLSAMLSVTLVEPLPSLDASEGTKLGSKRIFVEADVNKFPSIYDLFDPSLQKWRLSSLKYLVVKMDDEVIREVIGVCDEWKN
ncbi:uncharacterized protein MONOS_15016 [Monocercomonoides exilis]|uniref:uncharacterized protein n=1 Tax=Monocercomonoides exilis TaxID=2049356 RepID=UPI00355A73AF|nr:hypothetical protein MONOS_15016 [Monocercomonoides exilis]|eukprot:MONOS_15016.1-p1 / transcript=MONOS_15016.1 / gene=MONOS_15016 / organism=Monocercomonoides_exilis_PA203 / gene_product=unspecified product / transcript_product=unspecified product / location=Mono_scaffold01127:4371-4637(-) / protein_length=89 / sequence_SO=supercontig / SO=protein_coding / is_pseudo=false